MPNIGTQQRYSDVETTRRMQPTGGGA